LVSQLYAVFVFCWCVYLHYSYTIHKTSTAPSTFLVIDLEFSGNSSHFTLDEIDWLNERPGPKLKMDLYLVPSDKQVEKKKIDEFIADRFPPGELGGTIDEGNGPQAIEFKRTRLSTSKMQLLP